MYKLNQLILFEMLDEICIIKETPTALNGELYLCEIRNLYTDELIVSKYMSENEINEEV